MYEINNVKIMTFITFLVHLEENIMQIENSYFLNLEV